MSTSNTQKKKATFEDLSSEEKIIESARLRTNAFAKALDSYNRDTFDFPRENFEGTNLPSWNNINNSTLNFINNVKAFTDFLDPLPGSDEAARIPLTSGSRRKFLENASLFANAKFPHEKGYGNDITMYELLRRRPDQAVTAWEQKMVAVGKDLEDGTMVNGTKVHEDEWVSLWNWAAITGDEMLQGFMKKQEDGEDVEFDDDVSGADNDGDTNMGEDAEAGEGATVGEEKGKGPETSGDKGKGPAVASVPAPMPLAYTLAYLSNGYDHSQSVNVQR